MPATDARVVRDKSVGQKRPQLRSIAVLAALTVMVGLLSACDRTPVLLDGQVTIDRIGDPAASVELALYSDADAIVAQTTSSASGHYRFTQGMVAEGTYRLKVTGRWWPDATSWDEASPIELSAAAPSTLDVEVSSVASLSGGVVDADGNPIADVLVAARRTTDDVVVGASPTGGDGAFRVSLHQPGEHVLFLIDLTGTSPPIAVGASTPTVYDVDANSHRSIGRINLTTGGPYVSAPIATGSEHTCAVDPTGALSCWGRDDHGQVSLAPTSGTFTTVSAGVNHTCALATDASISCWGSDSAGLVSNAPHTGDYAAIDAGNSHSCALTTDGAVTCWGSDLVGSVSGAPRTGTYTAVTAGATHSCAISSTGSVRCWGYDVDGSVADTPTDGTYIAVAAGSSHTCAITTAGALRCWGYGSFGQVTDAPTFGTFTAVAASQDHNCALTTAGAIRCWGRNLFGQVGDRPRTGSFRAVDTGYTHSCASAAEGAIICWGRNNHGQAGPPA